MLRPGDFCFVFKTSIQLCCACSPFWQPSAAGCSRAISGCLETTCLVFADGSDGQLSLSHVCPHKSHHHGGDQEWHEFPQPPIFTGPTHQPSSQRTWGGTMILLFTWRLDGKYAYLSHNCKGHSWSLAGSVTCVHTCSYATDCRYLNLSSGTQVLADLESQLLWTLTCSSMRDDFSVHKES